jgi:hypothetical protein
MQPRPPALLTAFTQKVNSLYSRFFPALQKTILQAYHEELLGANWSGQFTPKGIGDSKAKVLIGRYGEGALPRIDGEGKHLDTVLLKNISFVEVADLEITNRGKESAPHRHQYHRRWYW